MTKNRYEGREEIIKKSVENILIAVGENPDREGLKETPSRIAKMYLEDLFKNVEKKPEDLRITVFNNDEKYDEMVIVKNAIVPSSCEHHLVPFICNISIGYLPAKKYCGLSKLIRVAEFFAKRPQVQERLTGQIADYLFKVLKPSGVVVMIEAEHLCLSVRGVKKPGHKTITMAIRGKIDKMEFLKLVRG